MCQHPHPPSGRAISLGHGDAHDHDHARWTRRDFLVRSGLAAVGGAVAVGGTPVRAMARSPLLDALARAETDRVLVLIQLQGGNDGLNTVVPVRNDVYARARPTLAIPRAETIALDADHGLHAALDPLRSMWDAGDLSIVQGVGYPDQDLSHFRGTDIWLSASDADEVLTSGWAGRALAYEHPDLDGNPPSAPPAVQIGTSAPLLFEGDGAGYGMAMLDIDVFLRLAEGGDPYPTTSLPATPYGEELGFVRRIANDAFRYRDAIESATQAGRNEVAYPDSDLGRELAAVAQLVKGRLGSRIYLVSLPGFDTHAGQPEVHARLLGTLAQSLAAFYADLGATGDDERTLALTFSEFGRRVEENGSNGTDHGTAAPLFLAGPAAEGGLYGPDPDLENLDRVGNLRHTTDFRQVYASVLERWLELTPQDSAAVLGGTFAPLDVVASGGATSAPTAPDAALRLDTPAPNPVQGTATVRYALAEPGHATLDVFDVRGRRVRQLADVVHGPGDHRAAFDASALPAGVYVLRLTAHGQTRSVQATVVR